MHKSDIQTNLTFLTIGGEGGIRTHGNLRYA